MLSKKNRIVASLVSLGSVLALAGAGYAAWVIAGSNQTDNSQGATVEAYAVTDKRIALTVTPATNGGETIVFGKVTDSNITNPWLLAESGVKDESLSYSFTATVTNPDYCKDVTASIAIDSANSEAWNNAVTPGYVAALAQPTVTKDTSNTDKTKVIYTISGTFGWGEHFNKENPYKYYNSKTSTGLISQEKTTTYADDASTALGVIAELDKIHFTLTVKATYQESATNA